MKYTFAMFYRCRCCPTCWLWSWEWSNPPGWCEMHWIWNWTGELYLWLCHYWLLPYWGCWCSLFCGP